MKYIYPSTYQHHPYLQAITKPTVEIVESKYVVDILHVVPWPFLIQ